MGTLVGVTAPPSPEAGHGSPVGRESPGLYDCFFDVAYTGNGWRRIVFGILAALLAVVTIYVSVGETDLLTWVAVLPQVALFAAVVLLLLRWLDSLRPQPPGHLAFALIWGAVGAYVLADVLGNLVRGQGWFGLASGDLSNWTAGPREELAKIIPVFVLFLICRRSFNGVLSAMVIGAVTGTGFAMIENIDNFTATLESDDQILGQTGWVGAELNLWLARNLVPPLVHQSLTAVAAAGFGIAAFSTSRAVRILAPIGTLLGAIIVHSLLDVGLNDLTWLALIVAIVIAVRARRNLRRLASEELPAYVEQHDITEQDAQTTPSIRERRKAALAERRRHGRRAARTLRQHYDAVMDLAILRRRRTTMDGRQEAAERRRILTEISRLTSSGH